MYWEVLDLKAFEYIQIVTDQIRCKKVRSFIADELAQHIDDQLESYLADGMSPEEAEMAAVREMGDPIKVGTDLDRIHRPKLDRKLVMFIALLTLAGLAVQFISADFGKDIWFLQQVFYTVLGLGVMILIYFADYTLLGKRPILAWLGWSALLIGLIYTNMGHMKWIIAGQHRYYPLITLLIPLFAGILYRFRGTSYAGFFCCGGFAASGLMLCLLNHTMSALVKLMLVFAAMMTYAVCKGWFKINKLTGYLTIYGSIGSGSIFYLAYYLLRPINEYNFKSIRLKAALHPEKYADGYGYFSMQIRELLNNTKWIGSAGNNSSFILAEDSYIFASDTMLIYIFATFGLLAGMVLLLVLYAAIARVLMCSLQQKNQLGSMVGFGCGCFFLTETVIYVMYNLGFTLFSPTYLPFFSKSGTGIIVIYALMGLVLSVYRNTNIIKEKSAGTIPKYRIRIERIS